MGQNGGRRPGAGRPKGGGRRDPLEAAKAVLRPAGEFDITEMAQAHAPAALETLVRIMKCDIPSAAISAANALLDRGYGRPAQTHTLDHKVTVDADAFARLAEALERLQSGGESGLLIEGSLAGNGAAKPAHTNGHGLVDVADVGGTRLGKDTNGSGGH